MTDTINRGLRGAGDHLRGLPKVFQGFKDFISRGNAIELAVGVVIGAAFTTVVTAIQNGFIGPLIAAIFGQPDLSDLWSFTINKAEFSIGLILNALLQFLITAAAVYFVIVLPLNALAARRKRGEEEEPKAPAEDILLLQEIRDLLAARPNPAVANDAGAGAVPQPGSATDPRGVPGAPGTPPTFPPGSGPSTPPPTA
ncbi:large conductance mechanosensitive channel protein MscL [Cellulomonas fimi]|uniref:large conductance mechanosensitive channel protein MscL n=1 Tax=Cellulomonas fimi TaxID=1708 RepID=UPI00234CC762|nr:large conductance mechanosensitive channel protein MscL [Cellulomonas fimi]MDC7123108.1 large conductance mechanosensitive channel protein MscL [Cellulomonas fimi]